MSKKVCLEEDCLRTNTSHRNAPDVYHYLEGEQCGKSGGKLRLPRLSLAFPLRTGDARAKGQIASLH